MTLEELQKDMERLESYNTGSVRFVVWDIEKLLWIYRHLLDTKCNCASHCLKEGVIK